MKKVYIKLLISILLSIFAIITLGTSTLAWFTIANSNRLDSLDIRVTGNTSFELSVDGVNFTKNITSEQIANAIGENVKLADVTSIDGKNFYNQYNKDEIAIPNQDYATYNLWVKAARDDLDYLFLVDNQTTRYNYDVLTTYDQIDGTYVFSKGIRWINDLPFDNGQGIVEANTPFIYYARDAVRIAISEEPLEERILGYVNNETYSPKIFDLTGDEERGFGKQIGAWSYYLAKTSIALELPEVNQPAINRLSTFRDPYHALNDNSQIAKFYKGIDGYYYAKVSISIWLEGWDADCFDSILADKIAIQLKFKGANFA